VGVFGVGTLSGDQAHQCGRKDRACGAQSDCRGHPAGRPTAFTWPQKAWSLMRVGFSTWLIRPYGQCPASWMLSCHASNESSTHCHQLATHYRHWLTQQSICKTWEHPGVIQGGPCKAGLWTFRWEVRMWFGGPALL